jgi:Ca-activated chloride channel family protein
MSEYFDSELVFLPREDGPGYIFALTVIPRPDLHLPKIRQHVTFLIDRSNSIQRERLAATKSAVQKAVEELYPDDTFNVIVFDSKLEKLFPSSVPADADHFEQAEMSLKKITLGSFFSPADPYKALFLTIPMIVQDDELYTAILITDGESLAKKNIQRSLLQDWTYQNGGRVSLYSLGMGADQHLATIDAACAFNKGRLISSTTHRGLKRKLLKLMKNIRAPVAKNITCKAISRSPKTTIELFPKSHTAPHLFLDHPYVIVGSTDSLDDFILFVQGRLKGQWLNIKKPISFLNAKRGGNTLRAEWALQRAYQKYAEYVRDDNPAHLTEARALLEPFDLQTAFE